MSRTLAARSGHLLLMPGAILAFLLPVDGRGQDLGVGCEIVSARSFQRVVMPESQSIVWMGTPNLLCANGARVRADSAISYSESGRNQLMGNVVFVDATRELRAREADHYIVQGQLFARGNVVFRDLGTGREIRGDSLTLLEASDSRPVDQLTVRGRPASALLPREDSTAGPGASPYQIEARVLRFEGDRFLWGEAEVEVQRDSLLISSDSLAFDRESGTLVFTGGARLEEEGAVFEGERMDVTLRDDVVEAIEIRGDGHLVNEDIELVAPWISITIQDEKIQGVLAARAGGGSGTGVSGDSVGGDAPAIPHLVAQQFFLVGDSLDIRSPNEVLDRVNALGRAWGQTFAEGDSLPPLDARPSQRLAAGPISGRTLTSDWIEAEEIQVLFGIVGSGRPGTAPSGEVAQDSVASAAIAGTGTDQRPEYFVTQLNGIRSARTLYRTPPEEEGDAPVSSAPPAAAQAEAPQVEREHWPLSYILADWITVYLSDVGEVQKFEAGGNVIGLQLDPDTGVPAAQPEDSL